MGRKSLVDRAVATGDWSAYEKQARKHLRKSNIQTLLARGGRLEKEEAVDDHFEDKFSARPYDERPPAKPREVEVIITLARAYQTYQARGGNRALPERVLKELGETPVEHLDRATVQEAARKRPIQSIQVQSRLVLRIPTLSPTRWQGSQGKRRSYVRNEICDYDAASRADGPRLL